MDLKTIALNKRKTTKRAVARFFVLNDIIDLDDITFQRIVNRINESGFNSGIKFLCKYFYGKGFSKEYTLEKLYKFTIEYNMESLAKQFPKLNDNISKIILGERNMDDNIYFRNTLYPIVKANSLQKECINNYLNKYWVIS